MFPIHSVEFVQRILKSPVCTEIWSRTTVLNTDHIRVIMWHWRLE